MSVEYSVSNSIIILAVMICLIVFAIAALLFGQVELAGVCIGIIGGWVAGNYNGKRQSS